MAGPALLLLQPAVDTRPVLPEPPDVILYLLERLRPGPRPRPRLGVIQKELLHLQ